MNDDHNTFDGVAHALAAVLPGVGFEQGMAFANSIHSSGRAVVWSGHKEQAEHYWAQLKDRGLTMAPLERCNPVRFRRVLLAITSGGKVGLGSLPGSSSSLRSSRPSTSRGATPTSRETGLALFVLVAVSSLPDDGRGRLLRRREEEEHGPRPSPRPRRKPATSPGDDDDRGGRAGRRRPRGRRGRLRIGGLWRCHTLEAAGSSGTVGPNLDEAKPDATLVVERVTNGKSPMPSFKGQLDDEADPRRRRLRRRVYARLAVLDTLSPARRGVRAAEGARLEIA